MTGYVRRDVAGLITEALRDMPVVVLTGMRQTGKSTFLQMEDILRGRKYITFLFSMHLLLSAG